jgi:hypothetical protein
MVVRVALIDLAAPLVIGDVPLRLKRGESNARVANDEKRVELPSRVALRTRGSFGRCVDLGEPQINCFSVACSDRARKDPREPSPSAGVSTIRCVLMKHCEGRCDRSCARLAARAAPSFNRDKQVVEHAENQHAILWEHAASAAATCPELARGR